jgi:chromosomal replication initiation ATPase DnaA
MNATIEELTQRVARLEAKLGLGGMDVMVPDAAQLMKDICDAYQVTVEDVVGPRRFEEVIMPRHLFCWLARLSGLTTHAIGKMLNRNHATVLAACLGIEDRMDVDADFRRNVRQFAEARKIALPERYQQ